MQHKARRSSGLLLVAAVLLVGLLTVWLVDHRARVEVVKRHNEQTCIFRYYLLKDIEKQQAAISNPKTREPLRNQARSSIRTDDFLLRFLTPIPPDFNCTALIETLSKETDASA